MEKFICKSLEEIEKVKIDLNKILKTNKKTSSLSFNTDDLSEKYFNENILSIIKGHSDIIYIIKLKSKFDLRSRMEQFKIDDKSVKLPQINKDSSFEVLYVGSVQNNFQKRIKEHLGYGSNTTYSLKLCKLAKKEKLNIIIEYFVLENTKSKITLKLIENILANTLRPQFGKHDKII